MRRIITINYPPPGFRFVYVDEILNNKKFKEQVFIFMKKYDVRTYTAIVNGYITVNFDSIDNEYKYTAYRDCGQTRDPNFMLVINECIPI